MYKKEKNCTKRTNCTELNAIVQTTQNCTHLNKLYKDVQTVQKCTNKLYENVKNVQNCTNYTKSAKLYKNQQKCKKLYDPLTSA